MKTQSTFKQSLSVHIANAGPRSAFDDLASWPDRPTARKRLSVVILEAAAGAFALGVAIWALLA